MLTLPDKESLISVLLQIDREKYGTNMADSG